MHPTHLRLAIVLGGLVVTAQPASAQAASVRIRGQVTDSLGVPIQGADVLLRSASVTMTTDSLGLFSFGPLVPGLHLLQVRAIGWRPVYFTIQTEPGQEWVGRVGLEQAPQALPELRVTGRLAKPARYAGTGKYDDFFRRRRTATGVFRLRDEIDRLAPLYTGDLLKGIPSIRVSFSGGATSVRFDRCKEPGAKVSVWLDGVRIQTRSHARGPARECGPRAGRAGTGHDRAGGVRSSGRPREAEDSRLGGRRRWA